MRDSRATARASSRRRRGLSANINRFNLATDLRYAKSYLAHRAGAAGRAQPVADRRRPRRRCPPARLEQLRRRAGCAAALGRAVGLLVGDRNDRLGGGRRLRRGPEARARADQPYPAAQFDGDRRNRRSGDRRLARGRPRPQLLARSGARIRHVAPISCAGRRGERAGLSRPQRQWRARPAGAVREGRAGHDRSTIVGESDRRKGHRC